MVKDLHDFTWRVVASDQYLAQLKRHLAQWASERRGLDASVLLLGESYPVHGSRELLALDAAARAQYQAAGYKLVTGVEFTLELDALMKK